MSPRRPVTDPTPPWPPAPRTATLRLLGVLQDAEVSYVEKLPGHRPSTSFTAAATLPAHPTALSRALLAFAAPPWWTG